MKEVKEQIVRLFFEGNDTKAEVVGEIVRCKDCKHRPIENGANHDIEFPDGRCPCQCEETYSHWYSWMPDDDWFCANGERTKGGVE